jgi:ribosomal protein S18 acetylase RimI-like enzyme
MDICSAYKEDFSELLSFYNRMCAILREQDFLPEGDKGGFPSEAMIRESIEKKGQFVGIEDGRIVAAYIIDPHCDPAYHSVRWQINAKPEDVMILHALRVLPEYSGRGYSKQLVRHAIQTAKERGQKAVRLDCIEGNDIPQNMYQSLGFRFMGSAGITYPDIGMPRLFFLYEVLL